MLSSFRGGLSRVRGVLSSSAAAAANSKAITANAACQCATLNSIARVTSASSSPSSVCGACSARLYSTSSSSRTRTAAVFRAPDMTAVSAAYSNQPQHFKRFSQLQPRFFSTAEKPKDGGDAKAGDAKADGAKADSEGSKEGGQKGDGQAGAEFSSTDGAPPKSKFWKYARNIAIGTGIIYLASNYGTDAFNWTLERMFLVTLRHKHAGAIPDIDEIGYNFLHPVALSGMLSVKQNLVSEPEMLDALIQTSLRLPGLEQGVVGVSSENLDLKAMAKAHWTLTVLLGAASNDDVVVRALRAAHLRSVTKQKKTLEEWDANEKLRFETETKERAALIAAHEAELTRELKDKKAVAERMKEFKAGFAPIEAPRKALPRSELPMSLLDIVVQHGLHHKCKDTPQQFEEEFVKKWWKTREDNEQKSGKAPLSVEEQQAARAQAEGELAAVLDTQRPIFNKLIEGQVEKSLAPQAWSLVKLLIDAPPQYFKDGHLLGEDRAFRAAEIVKELKEELTMLQGIDEKVAVEKGLQQKRAERMFELEEDIENLEVIKSMRFELLNKWLVPMCLLMAPAQPGKQAIWGPEGSGAAMEVLGTLLFDIPDLGATFKRLPQHGPVQNALFSSLANLAGVYSEGHYPGAAVRACQLVLQCDPNNHNMMSTLAVELIKLGDAKMLDQLRRDQAQQTADGHSLPAAALPTPDPRKNPFLNDAINMLKKALTLDPTNLDANFQLLKALVSTGERDERALNSAVDKLIKAVRHAPTTVEPPGLALLPGAAPDAMAPFAEPLPALSPAYNLLIRTLERLNRLDEASELASEWSFRLHADALSHFTLGRLLLRENDVEGAEAALRIAYDLDPSKPEILYHLALARFKAGDLNETDSLVDQALAARVKVEKKVRESVNRSLLADMMPRASSEGETGSNVKTPPRYLVANTIPNAYLLRAKVSAKRGLIQDALDQSDVFIKEKPFAPEGYIFQAKLLQQEKRTREAYETLTRLVRVWQKRIQAPVAATTGSGNKVKVNRKAYFDDKRHASEKKVFDQLEKTCAVPSDKAAAAQHKQLLTDVAEFKTLCDEMQKLKAL